jgi:hypothetical protein
MDNGMKSSVLNQLEVVKSNSQLPRKITSQFQELKFTLLNALDVVATEDQVELLLELQELEILELVDLVSVLEENHQVLHPRSPSRIHQ